MCVFLLISYPTPFAFSVYPPPILLQYYHFLFYQVRHDSFLDGYNSFCSDKLQIMLLLLILLNYILEKTGCRLG